VVLRRGAPEEDEEVLSAGGLKLNTASHRVTGGDEVIGLGPTEYRLLNTRGRALVDSRATDHRRSSERISRRSPRILAIPGRAPARGFSMSFQESLFLAFTILGGLALFLFGMQLMTEGLRLAAGDRLRLIIYRGTGNRIAGLGLGTGLGFLMHSSATTVMTVGFINAGLLSLVHALPVIMGANVGTTLSMQLIAFRLTDYALAAVALGFLLSVVGPTPVVRNLGRGLLGFGLLFNGMDLMSGAIEPHSETLVPWLSRFDGSSWSGMLLGTLLAWLFTAVVQSSGATIGMIFVLISAGVFNSLQQVYPIVLGAHLGTTTTALIAALGCGIEARRGAVANLLFNGFNVMLALLAAPLFIAAIELTSGDLVRQTANLHTAIMVVAAIVLLPATRQVAGLLGRMLPANQPVAAASFLDPELITRPENALVAVIRESRRSLDIAASSLEEARAFVARGEGRRGPPSVRSNENAINEIRDATDDYLHRMARRYLSRRQRLLAQYLSRIARDIERIGDYIMHLVTLTEQQRRIEGATYDEHTHDAVLVLFDEAERVLAATRRSLDPDTATFPAAARAIEAARDAFSERSQAIRQAVNARVAEHQVPATVGILFGNVALSFDALARHCRLIAREQQQPYFALKPSKLDRVEPPASVKTGPHEDGTPDW
jgi:phosphate:Na+ symporter